MRGGHRSTDTEVHRKEKENRKLQLELRAEKEKLNSTIIKYQRELMEMQAVSTPTPPATAKREYIQTRFKETGVSGRYRRRLHFYYLCKSLFRDVGRKVFVFGRRGPTYPFLIFITS